MDIDKVRGSDAAAIIAAVKDLHGFQTVPVYPPGDLSTLGNDVALVPKGMELLSLKPFRDEYRIRPERKRGVAIVTDLDSLIALADRHKIPDSVIFADRSRTSPSITVIVNYHDEDTSDGLPRFGDHRAFYPLALSDEWQAWTKADGKPMDQREFAVFLEDRALDLAPLPEWLQPGTDTAPSTPAEHRLRDAVARLGGRVAGPERLIELSRGLDLTENAQVKQKVNLDSGEVAFVYTAEHSGVAGERVAVPNLFLIAVPVFRKGPLWLLAVRLRYALGGGQVKWRVQIARAEETFDAALEADARRASEVTGLPLYYGTPEMKA